MKLEDFCYINPKETLKRNEEYDFVEMADLTPGTRYVFSALKKAFGGSYSKFKNEDVLMAKITPCLENGKIAQYKGSGVGFGSTEFNIFRAKEGISDANFLYYLISSNTVKDIAIKSMSGACGRQRANIEEIKQIDIPEIDIAIQQKIASVLSNYDNLIENNNKRIKILEEMAQKIYKEWFVDFKFPGHETTSFKDSELGKIPLNWGIKKLSEIANITMGQSPESKYYNEAKKGLPFHQGVTNFGQRFPTNKVYCTQENRLALPEDILLSVRAPVGRINITNKKIIIGRGLAALNSKTKNNIFLYYFLSNIFQKEDQYGNGAVFNAITKAELESISFGYPDGDAIKQFEHTICYTHNLVANLIYKNETLKQTRNLLLPRLISGEIDVENMEIV